MSQTEVLEALDARVAACRVEAERLREEVERITVLLMAREEELVRLATARDVVAELPLPVVERGVLSGRRVAVPKARSGPVREVAGPAEQVLAVLASVRGPMRAGQVAERLGLEPGAGNVEKVRHRLKKAVAAGSAVQTPGGLFTLRGGGGARESDRA